MLRPLSSARIAYAAAATAAYRPLQQITRAVAVEPLRHLATGVPLYKMIRRSTELAFWRCNKTSEYAATVAKNKLRNLTYVSYKNASASEPPDLPPGLRPWSPTWNFRLPDPLT